MTQRRLNQTATAIPKGTSGGQFTSDTGGAGIPAPPVSVNDELQSALEGWGPERHIVYPQANDLGRVALTVLIAARGVDTANLLGEALREEMDGDASASAIHRDGAYYANAAAWLGLLERVETGGDVETGGEYIYTVTALGDLLVDSEPDDMTVLSELVRRIPDIDEQNDDQAVQSIIAIEQMHGRQVSEDTAVRRLAGVRSWKQQVDDVQSLASSIDMGYELHASAIDEAEKKARVRRDDRERAREAQARAVERERNDKCSAHPWYPRPPLCPECD